MALTVFCLDGREGRGICRGSIRLSLEFLRGLDVLGFVNESGGRLTEDFRGLDVVVEDLVVELVVVLVGG